MGAAIIVERRKLEMMKKHIILSALLCLGFTGSLLAQSIVPDTLLFVFKLHGQTRKYEMSFREKQDSICL